MARYCYEVEVWGGRFGARKALGVFSERRTAEAWIRSLGDGVQNHIHQTSLNEPRRHEPDLSAALPGRPLPTPDYSIGRAIARPPRRLIAAPA